MKLNRTQAIEYVGVASVVASLLFVGVQLYLDRKAALSTQYANRAESVKEDIRTRMESETWLSDQGLQWESGVRPNWWNELYESLHLESGRSGAQFTAFQLERRLYLLQFDNVYYQHQQGYIDDEFIESGKRLMKAFMRNEFVREIYINSARSLPILPVIEELVEEIDSEVENAANGT